MSPSVSIVIPVRDGARWLEEVLAAVLAQEPGLEVLVIDSGSTDGSPEIARAAGVDVLEIDPAEFGHGRTRNLGAERTSGELIAFLTQDATPVPGWLAAHRQALALDPRAGASYGPHLPRPETSPMIARELTEFFGAMAPDGEPVVQDAQPFLSNVNACYRRECWEQIRFADLPYSEDQAFGRAMLEAGWRKVFHPGAAVLHAHDYGAVGFMRRYFDEYRGLRATSGHVAPVRGIARHVGSQVRADRQWMRARDWPAGRRAAWTARAAVHHAGRRVFSALGSRADRLPDPVQRSISLEGRGAAPAGPAGPARTPVPQPPSGRPGYQPILELARDGVADLLEPVPGQADAERLHVAVVIPPFKRGSGGHSTIYNLLTRLEDRGHTVTTWLHDPMATTTAEWAGVVAGDLREFFRPPRGPVFKGFDQWFGADVVLATGWDTVYPVLRLDHCRARAYLVQDHEPEFYATSAESVFAEGTYGHGLFCIAASPWLRDLLAERYGAPGTAFELGVDHDVYHPRPVQRRTDTVIFYARSVTPRRAVPLGLLALAELRRRRPDLRIVLFGDREPNDAPFTHEHLGVATPDELAWAYSEATIGLSLSLTNYSLIPQEMLACGLPVVELGGGSVESVYGADGPIELAEADPIALADAMERLLADAGLRARRSAAGLEFAAGLTWDRAADELEAGLREALRRRTAVPPAAAGVAPGSMRSSRGLHRSVPVQRSTDHEATERIFARLRPEDVAAVEASLDETEQALYDRAGAGERRRLILIFGVWNGVEGVLERSGLTRALPPEDVHAMARGYLSAGGDLYYADMLAAALRRVGGAMEEVERGLDFGSSSGRVVRAVHAAWPDASWHGVDPNEGSIAWASASLPGIDFRVSPQDPPLPFADGELDLVFAISIWSHYAEGAARRWLEEMHRVIRPGGHLIITTHGYQSINHYAGTGERSAEQLEQIRRELYRAGYWFAPEFGEAGDWGVRHSEWGTAFLTPEWLAAVATPDWAIEDFAVGQNAGNQDLYTLRRR
jgi:glycosyltransferase involved in cell wall biosynthesis/SAM-dependent methyltransferase